MRHISKFGESGFILASNINSDNATAVIKNEVSYFKNLQQDFEWKVYSYDKPDHLKDLLEQKGFTDGEPEALMVMKLTDGHPFLVNSQLHDVKEITDEQGIQAIVNPRHYLE